MSEPVYPPARHLLRDLAVSGERRPGMAVNRLPHQPGLADQTGALRLGALAALVDTTGAGIALASVAPDWIATADLSCHLIGEITDDVLVTCRPLRTGSSTVVIGAEAHDAAGELRGIGRMAFARIPRAATRSGIEVDVENTEPVPFSIDGGTPLDESVLDRCGVVELGPGELAFEKSPYVANSFGTVNGGVMALVAEAAAVSAASATRAVDLQIHYLEQVGTGPVAVTAVVARTGVVPLCEVAIVDSATDTLVAVAEVVVA